MFALKQITISCIFDFKVRAVLAETSFSTDLASAQKLIALYSIDVELIPKIIQ